jgi:hypothetical protein
MRHLYRPAYSRATGPADLLGRRLLSVLRTLRNLFVTRAQGVVLLWK